MAKQNNPFSKFKLVYYRSSPLVKILAVVAIVFSILAITALTLVRLNIEGKTAQLRNEALLLEQENAALEAKIAILGTVQGVRMIAEEELGLVPPDTVVIDIK